MRKNISLSKNVEDRAQAIIEARGFDGLSDLIATLVREEFERRTPPVLQDKPGTPPPPATPATEPVTYSKKRKSSSKVAVAEKKIVAAIRAEAAKMMQTKPEQ